MNVILIDFSSIRSEAVRRKPMPRRYHPVVAGASSIAPDTFFKKKIIQFSSFATPELSYRPPRYFTRGPLESKPGQIPFFFLLTETTEMPRIRRLPNDRKLLRSICRGKGVLRQNEQGFVFLDIDNQFILGLLPYLQPYGLARPPYFDLFSSPEGAHIPVIGERESFFQDIGSMKELDREFSFEIEGLYSVAPNTWPEVEQVWFFKVHSPELETLRRKHFLPALPGGHSFTIAIAIKPSSFHRLQTPTLRISPCVSAA